MAPTGGRMLSVILCFSFLVVFLPCSAYRKYNIGHDRVCSHVKKQTVKLGPPENGILITEDRTFDKWSGFKEFRCKFKVELQDEGDLFVVIQNLNFRKDPLTGECMDYIQFTGNDKIKRTEKICGTVNAVKRLYGNAVQSFSDTTPIAFVDSDGEISVEVYVANEPLSSNSEELTLSLAFTQTVPCGSRNSFACAEDKCIPMKFKLDGIVNCPYGSCLDEHCTFGDTEKETAGEAKKTCNLTEVSNEPLNDTIVIEMTEEENEEHMWSSWTPAHLKSITSPELAVEGQPKKRKTENSNKEASHSRNVFYTEEEKRAKERHKWERERHEWERERHEWERLEHEKKMELLNMKITLRNKDNDL